MSIEVRMSMLSGHAAMKELSSNPVILIPMGSHEDQGPHAPMGDFLLAEKIAELAAKKSFHQGIPAFVAPVIPFGGDDFFRERLGGISLTQKTMNYVLKDVLNSLINNGLTKIIILNGHFGNVSPISISTREAFVEKKVTVPSVYLWEVAFKMLKNHLGEERAYLRAGHGADPLGSITLHLFPDAFIKENIPQQKFMKLHPEYLLRFEGPGKILLDDMPVYVPNEYKDTFNNGVGNGDPGQCDAETGKYLVEELTSLITNLIEKVSSGNKGEDNNE